MLPWKVIGSGLALLLAALQANLWFGQGSIAELVSLGRQLERLEVGNQRLRDRNDRLAVEVSELKSGLDSVEEMAREELGMVRQDETFFVVVKR